MVTPREEIDDRFPRSNPAVVFMMLEKIKNLFRKKELKGGIGNEMVRHKEEDEDAPVKKKEPIVEEEEEDKQKAEATATGKQSAQQVMEVEVTLALVNNKLNYLIAQVEELKRNR